jgi:hypothetical protein
LLGKFQEFSLRADFVLISIARCSREALDLRFCGLDGNDFSLNLPADITGQQLMEKMILDGRLPSKAGATLQFFFQDQEISGSKMLKDLGVCQLSTISYVYKRVDLWGSQGGSDLGQATAKKVRKYSI